MWAGLKAWLRWWALRLGLGWKPVVGRLRCSVWVGLSLTEGVLPMFIKIPVDRVGVCLLKPVDTEGNPAPVDGLPVWEAALPELVKLTVAEDGLSVRIAPVGPLGATQITVSADVRLGPEVKTVQDVIEVVVIGGEAVSLGLTDGGLLPLAE